MFGKRREKHCPSRCTGLYKAVSQKRSILEILREQIYHSHQAPSMSASVPLWRSIFHFCEGHRSSSAMVYNKLAFENQIIASSG